MHQVTLVVKDQEVVEDYPVHVVKKDQWDVKAQKVHQVNLV